MVIKITVLAQQFSAWKKKYELEYFLQTAGRVASDPKQLITKHVYLKQDLQHPSPWNPSPITPVGTSYDLVNLIEHQRIPAISLSHDNCNYTLCLERP